MQKRGYSKKKNNRGNKDEIASRNVIISKGNDNNDKEDMDSYDQAIGEYYNVSKKGVIAIKNNNENVIEEQNDSVEEEDKDKINRRSAALYSKGKEEIIKGEYSIREDEVVEEGER